MIETMMLSVAIFAIAGLGLGIGVLLRRQPIAGSCGGVACLKKLGLGCAGGCHTDEEKDAHHDR